LLKLALKVSPASLPALIVPDKPPLTVPCVGLV